MHGFTNEAMAAGVLGNSNVGNGVRGTAIAAEKSGVRGENIDGYGVYGESEKSFGVYAISNQGTAIRAEAQFSGRGVYASSVDGIGIQGESTNSNGVVAISTALNGFGVSALNAAGGTAVYGFTNGDKAAVYGESSISGDGVKGASGLGNGVFGIGPIGIRGATSASTGLAGQFDGNVRIVGSSNPNALLTVGAGSGLSTDKVFRVLGDGSPLEESVTVLRNGNVGIGITTPSQRLHVVGNIHATGTITMSDLRYKQHVAPIPQALGKITQLRGVSYLWKSAEYPQMKFSDRVQLGFIAQELKDVLPEAVHQDAQGMYSVNYSAVIPMLVEGMKEQQSLIKTLQTEKDALAQRLAALEQLMQQLKEQAEKQPQPKKQ